MSEDSSSSPRQQALSEYRRQLILDAARRVFERHGFEGTTMRAIAKEAGYTTGGLYGNYANKEDIYAELLSQTLNALYRTVHQATLSCSEPLAKARTASMAFFDYYLDNPGDLDVGFYLFSGMKPRGLTRELDRRLNSELLQSLDEITTALEHSGKEQQQARQTTAAIFSHIVGVLMLTHTGRLRLLHTDSRVLIEGFLDQVLK